jgi:hypothetical protein
MIGHSPSGRHESPWKTPPLFPLFLTGFKPRVVVRLDRDNQALATASGQAAKIAERRFHKGLDVDAAATAEGFTYARRLPIETCARRRANCGKRKSATSFCVRLNASRRSGPEPPARMGVASPLRPLRADRRARVRAQRKRTALGLRGSREVRGATNAPAVNATNQLRLALRDEFPGEGRRPLDVIRALSCALRDDRASVNERRSVMLYAAIDIHKHAFQEAVLDPETGVVVEERFSADRESLARWAEQWRGRVAAVAIEATTGWRWVWRELVGNGFDVRLAEPVQTRALLGRRRSAKTDRLDARWLARLLAKEMLPESWIPPAQIQELRDRTRLRKALAEDRRRWGQRLHAYLLHEGWPCSRSNLLRPPGLRWAAALQLSEHARLQVDSLLSVMAALQTQLDTVDAELRRFARADERCQALQSINSRPE